MGVPAQVRPGGVADSDRLGDSAETVGCLRTGQAFGRLIGITEYQSCLIEVLTEQQLLLREVHVQLGPHFITDRNVTLAVLCLRRSVAPHLHVRALGLEANLRAAYLDVVVIGQVLPGECDTLTNAQASVEQQCPERVILVRFLGVRLERLHLKLGERLQIFCEVLFTVLHFTLTGNLVCLLHNILRDDAVTDRGLEDHAEDNLRSLERADSQSLGPLQDDLVHVRHREVSKLDLIEVADDVTLYDVLVAIVRGRRDAQAAVFADSLFLRAQPASCLLSDGDVAGVDLLLTEKLLTDPFVQLFLRLFPAAGDRLLAILPGAGIAIETVSQLDAVLACDAVLFIWSNQLFVLALSPCHCQPPLSEPFGLPSPRPTNCTNSTKRKAVKGG